MYYNFIEPFKKDRDGPFTEGRFKFKVRQLGMNPAVSFSVAVEYFGFGLRVHRTYCRMGFRGFEFGFRVQGLELGVQGWGLGFRCGFEGMNQVGAFGFCSSLRCRVSV